jgi:hypothetical protein
MGSEGEAIQPSFYTGDIKVPKEDATMATKRTMTATVRRENGHQVIVLPDEIQFEGDEVVVRQDLDTGEVTVITAPTPPSPFERFLAWRDANPIPDEEWAAFDDAMRDRRKQEAPPDDNELLGLFRDES